MPLKEITRILPLNYEQAKEAKLKLIEILKSFVYSLESVILEEKIEQQLSENEVKDFFRIASDAVEQEMKWITQVSAAISNDDSNSKKFDCVARIRELIPAEAFFDDKTIGYVNFKESFSSSTLYSFRNCWLRSFLYQPKQEYRVFPENLEKAFQSLELTEKQIIIGFHFNWYDAYPKNLQQENDYQFKSPAPSNRLLYSLPGDHTIGFIDTVIILNRADLPKLKFIDPPSGEKDKLNMECINEKYKLYASVIKLADNKLLLDEYINTKTYREVELKQAAMVCTEWDAQVLWKKDIHMVMIKVMNRFIDSGNENLSEIRPFNAD